MNALYVALCAAAIIVSIVSAVYNVASLIDTESKIMQIEGRLGVLENKKHVIEKSPKSDALAKEMPDRWDQWVSLIEVEDHTQEEVEEYLNSPRKADE